MFRRKKVTAEPCKMSTQQYTTVEISKDGKRTTTTTQVCQQNFTPGGGSSFQQSSWTKSYTSFGTAPSNCGSNKVASSAFQIQNQSFPSNLKSVNVVHVAPTAICSKGVAPVAKSNCNPCKAEDVGVFETECLNRHNMYRKKHKVPELQLSKSLCNYAKEWAEKLAREDSFRHRTDNKYGENIYMKWSSNPEHKVNGCDPVDDWYSEIKKYQGQYSSGTGHFSQVVWKNSKMLGVGIGRSRSGKIIVVANYDPPGNVMGHFQENVFI